MINGVIQNLSKALIGLGSSLVDLAFPPVCSGCSVGLEEGERIVCEGCWSGVNLLSGPRCPKCGAALQDPVGECPCCSGRSYRFSRACVLTSYDESTQQLIHLLKYREKTSVGVRLGRMLAEAMATDPEFAEVDLIVPVPLHHSRARERGYNQSALIARGVGQTLNIRVDKRTLVRRKATRTQTELSAEERIDNVATAFGVRRPERVAGLQLLLVDDVFTTGATVDACAAVLLDSGAKVVFVGAIASAFKG